MERDYLERKERIFLQKQRECIHQELRDLEASGSYDILLGLHYELGEKGKESSLTLGLQSPVASTIETMMVEENFTREFEDMIDEADIVTSQGPGPLTSIALHYNPVRLTPFSREKGKTILIGRDSIKITAFPDRMLLVTQDYLKKQEQTSVTSVHAKVPLAINTWQSEESPLIDILTQLLQKFPPR